MISSFPMLQCHLTPVAALTQLDLSRQLLAHSAMVMLQMAQDVSFGNSYITFGIIYITFGVSYLTFDIIYITFGVTLDISYIRLGISYIIFGFTCNGMGYIYVSEVQIVPSRCEDVYTTSSMESCLFYRWKISDMNIRLGYSTGAIRQGYQTRILDKESDGIIRQRYQTGNKTGDIRQGYQTIIFCRNYYQIDQALYPEEPPKIDNLARKFKDFLESVSPLVSIERQMSNLVSCMSVLFSIATLDAEDMEEFQEKYGSGVDGKDVRSDARKAYEEFYEGEEEINRQLNVFAQNMKAHINSFINKEARNPEERYQMAEKLVKQLSIEQLELDLKCLQLLRGLLHNEIVKLPLDFEVDMKSAKKQLKMIEDVQNALNKYDCIDGTLEHLSRPSDDVVRELLAFLAALLFNGNEDGKMYIYFTGTREEKFFFAMKDKFNLAQVAMRESCGQAYTSMYDFFTTTREETFFFAIKQRMTLAIIATRERRVLQAMHHAKIEEALAQTKALQKAMAAGTLAEMAVRNLKKNIVSSMSSMRRSMQSLGGRPKSRASRARSPTSLKAPFLAPPGGGSKVGPLNGGIEMGKLGGSRLSGMSSGRPMNGLPTKGNQVVPNSEMPDLEFKDDGYIELVLRILGLMCDNQHDGLQNYLREQPDNIKSVNLVGETTKFLNILYASINKNSVGLITQVFETLVEFTSGNSVNQSVVFDNKICDYVNHILRVGVYQDCKDDEVYSLKHAIGILIRCLTEENSKSNSEEQMSSLPRSGEMAHLHTVSAKTNTKCTFYVS
ncbi:ITPR3-like protein [Mya arenaria]|uniref:ITPR3-like protein n=1 Tax=Mya arenaria TaxID=6604 RepID=A0ABY7FZV4_MYAAR|nr:ITPR3-like protein [Mya arenaria]